MANIKLEHFRKQFPHTERGIIYMNHAAQSPLPKTTVDAINEHLQGRHNGMMMTYPRDMEIMAQCKSRIAELTGAQNTNQIAFIGNTSEGLNRVTSGLQWRAGDEIILNTIEFPSNVYPYRKLEAQGVRCIFVDADDGTVPVDRIAAAITPNTRMIAISAVQFLSGYHADMKTLGELCRRNNIWFVVDGIQAAGIVPVDIAGWGVDAFATGGLKWLMAPTGIGFLYLSERMNEHLDTPDPGWLSVEKPWDLFRTDQPLRSDAQRFEGGVVNIPGVYGLNASIGLLLETGIAHIYQHVQKCTQKLRQELEEFGLKTFTTADPKHQSGIITFDLHGTAVHNPANIEHLETIFRDRGIFLSVRDRKLRFAPHGYNTLNEIEQIIRETKAILSEL